MTDIHAEASSRPISSCELPLARRLGVSWNADYPRASFWQAFLPAIFVLVGGFIAINTIIRPLSLITLLLICGEKLNGFGIDAYLRFSVSRYRELMFGHLWIAIAFHLGLLCALARRAQTGHQTRLDALLIASSMAGGMMLVGEALSYALTEMAGLDWIPYVSIASDHGPFPNKLARFFGTCGFILFLAFARYRKTCDILPHAYRFLFIVAIPVGILLCTTFVFREMKPIYHGAVISMIGISILLEACVLLLSPLAYLWLWRRNAERCTGSASRPIAAR